MMFMAVFWLVVLVLAARWLLASEAGRPLAEESRSRRELDRLREEVDRLSAQVERLQEEQSFLLRLLSEGERPLSLRARLSAEGGEAHPSPASHERPPTP